MNLFITQVTGPASTCDMVVYIHYKPHLPEKVTDLASPPGPYRLYSFLGKEESLKGFKKWSLKLIMYKHLQLTVIKMNSTDQVDFKIQSRDED